MPDATVCRFVRPGSLKAAKLLLFSGYHTKEHKKRGASPVARSTCWGLRIAQFVETSNDESPTKNEYSGNPHAIQAGRQSAIRIHYGLSINTLRGVPVALFLTDCLNLRDSYFVKTKASENAYVHDVIPLLLTSRSQPFSAGIAAKVRIIIVFLTSK